MQDLRKVVDDTILARLGPHSQVSFHEIYEDVARDIGDVSRRTVHRRIAWLVKTGRLSKVGVVNRWQYRLSDAASRFRRGEAVPILDFVRDGAFPRLARAH